MLMLERCYCTDSPGTVGYNFSAPIYVPTYGEILQFFKMWFCTVVLVLIPKTISSERYMW